MSEVDDALDRLVRLIPPSPGPRRMDAISDVATVRNELERLREERDSWVETYLDRGRDLAAANDQVRRLTEGLRETKAALDRERGGGSPLTHKEYLALHERVRVLLSASPTDGGGATGPSFIPRDTDEYPSDAMPSSGHSDWREEAEWWQRTCEYWRARALGEPPPDGGGA